MRGITRLMVEEYRLKKLKYDFMGYTFEKTDQLSAHHLIIPASLNGKLTRDNTVILRQDTSHDYLHVIQQNNMDMFLAITSELIDENIIGKLTKENLCAIRDILLCFEREYCGTRTKNGNLIIKPEYIEKRIKLKGGDLNGM